MSKAYTTVQGDMWDMIAYREMGDVSHVDDLMRANASLLDYFIFPAGIRLTIPEVEKSGAATLPPWKEAAK